MKSGRGGWSCCSNCSVEYTSTLRVGVAKAGCNAAAVAGVFAIARVQRGCGCLLRRLSQRFE